MLISNVLIVVHAKPIYFVSNFLCTQICISAKNFFSFLDTIYNKVVKVTLMNNHFYVFVCMYVFIYLFEQDYEMYINYIKYNLINIYFYTLYYINIVII